MIWFRASSLALMAVLAVAVGLPIAAAAPAAAATTYTITDLGSLGGGVTRGLAINASGQVTGDSVLSTLVQVPCPPRQYGGQKKCFTHTDDAFVWSNGTMTDLGTLGGNFSQGVAISGSGEVVGSSSGKSPGTGGAFLSNSGHGMKPLSPPAEAYGINDSGTLQNLNNLIPAGSGYQIQNATGINDNGQIIANATDTATGQTHALLLNPS
jgi:probable HAF family extracellular repeat protein